MSDSLSRRWLTAKGERYPGKSVSYFDRFSFSVTSSTRRRLMAKKTINGALLDVTHTANHLGLTERGIWARVARNQIPYRRMGGRVVFVRRDLEKWIETLEGCSLREALDNVRGE